MKNNENKRMSFLVEDDDQKGGTEATKRKTSNKIERMKKPIIFVLMGVAFLGCLYLIFQPSADEDAVADIGLNGAVPQATGAGLQSDKQKAYEQELMRQKAEEKRKALSSLADYWNSDTAAVDAERGSDELYAEGDAEQKSRSYNPGLHSYRNAQEALNDFYEEDSKYVIEDLNEEIAELKEQLAQKEIPPNTAVQDQLALMEKSYEMAAKYLPSGQPAASVQIPDTARTQNVKKRKPSFTVVTPRQKKGVSNLQWLGENKALSGLIGAQSLRHFNSASGTPSTEIPRNSIKAVITKTRTVREGDWIRLRLLDDARTPEMVIPAGTLLSAQAKFNLGRLELSVTSIGYEGNIIPVQLSAYDLDGQLGLQVPYSPEVNALSSMASNMSRSSGSSIMMTRSAGQQVAGDLSRGLIQGISGYFSQKVSTPKITVKAGHQLLLKTKK